MASTPPPTELGAFFDWVRATTEAAWRLATDHTLADYEERGTGGAHWRRGTKWIGGYSDAEITSFERRDGVTFPLDFRLFLKRLGCTEPLRGGAYFLDSTNMAEREGPGFYDWRDESQIAGAREDVIGGLAFDVEHNRLWPADWGARPDAPAERERVLRAQVAAAPKLAPLFGHRFLLLEPATAGNPVISVHQSDLIVYGENLRAYLLNELEELGSDRDFQDPAYESRSSISFWGQFLS